MTRVARCKWTIRRFKNKEATQVTLCRLIYKVAVVNNKYRVLLCFFFLFFLLSSSTSLALMLMQGFRFTLSYVTVCSLDSRPTHYLFNFSLPHNTHTQTEQHTHSHAYVFLSHLSSPSSPSGSILVFFSSLVV